MCSIVCIGEQLYCFHSPLNPNFSSIKFNITSTQKNHIKCPNVLHNKEQLGTDNTLTIKTKNWIIRIIGQLNYSNFVSDSYYVCLMYITAMSLFFSDRNYLFCLCPSVKKEEEDLEDKKSIKKRIKELKVLDPKIAQNLCKYLCPSACFHFQGLDFMYLECICSSLLQCLHTLHLFL